MNSKGEPKEDEHHCIPLCVCVCVCVNYCVRECVCKCLYCACGRLYNHDIVRVCVWVSLWVVHVMRHIYTIASSPGFPIFFYALMCHCIGWQLKAHIETIIMHHHRIRTNDNQEESMRTSGNHRELMGTYENNESQSIKKDRVAWGQGYVCKR